MALNSDRQHALDVQEYYALSHRADRIAIEVSRLTDEMVALHARLTVPSERAEVIALRDAFRVAVRAAAT